MAKLRAIPGNQETTIEAKGIKIKLAFEINKCISTDISVFLQRSKLSPKRDKDFRLRLAGHVEGECRAIYGSH